MKKLLYFSVLALTCASLLTACKSDGYKKTQNGLSYRFEILNEKNEQPQLWDYLIGEMTVKLDTIPLMSNVGRPMRIMQVRPDLFKGDINEGLMMMHKGDKAFFSVNADSMAKFIEMPPFYTQGKGQMLNFEIALGDIVPKEELDQEELIFTQNMSQRQAEEPGLIEQYITENNITDAPTASGLYIVVNKKGNGPKVEAGKTVSIDYTGRLFDGTIFDSSRKADAEAAGKPNPKGVYKPIEYVVGATPMIKGWDEGVMGQPEGSELTLVMPSRLAYGTRGAGNDIPPFTPLVFNLTIISVK